MNKENKLNKVAFGIYFFIAICFVAIRMLSAFNLLSFLSGWTGYIFSFVIQVVLLFGGSVFVFSALMKKKPKETFSVYKFKKISSRSVIISILIGCVVFFLNIFISSFFNSIISGLGYKSESTIISNSDGYYPFWLFIVNIIFTAVLPAICEETAHRGMILNASSKFGIFKAILISSLMFGLLHLNIEQFFYATIIGVFLGYITTLTGSIYPAMIVHFMNNALSVFLSFSRVRGLGFASIFSKIALMFDKSILIGLLFSVSAFVLLIFLLKWLTKILFISTFRDMAIEGKKSLEKFLLRQNFFNGTDQPGQTKVIELTDKDLMRFFQGQKLAKMDGLTKIFFSLTIIMTGVLTIFTFVWGVL